MILTMAILQYLSYAEAIHPNKPFETFPKQIGEWKGKEKYFDKEIYPVLGVDDSFLANYRKPGHLLELYIGFYQSQKEGDLIHSPKNCLPGAGWNIYQDSLEEVDIPGDSPEKIKVIKLVIKKGSFKQIALYWFQSRGRIISSEYMQKVYLVTDAITRHRTDGSFVRLIAPVGKNEADTLKLMKKFTRLLMPYLKEYLPS